MPTADEVSADLKEHTAVCTFRYESLRRDMCSIDGKVDKIDAILQRLTWGIGALLLTCIGYLLIHYVVK